LSRAYLPFSANADEYKLAEDINVLVHSLLIDYLASIKQIEGLCEDTARNPELSQLMPCLRNGFEAGANLPQSMQQ